MLVATVAAVLFAIGSGLNTRAARSDTPACAATAAAAEVGAGEATAGCRAAPGGINITGTIAATQKQAALGEHKKRTQSVTNDEAN